MYFSNPTIAFGFITKDFISSNAVTIIATVINPQIDCIKPIKPSVSVGVLNTVGLIRITPKATIKTPPTVFLK